MAGYASNSIWGDAPAASDSIAMTNSGTQDNSHHMYSTGYSTQPAFAAPQGRSAREIELDTREAELRLREAKVSVTYGNSESFDAALNRLFVTV